MGKIFKNGFESSGIKEYSKKEYLSKIKTLLGDIAFKGEIKDCEGNCNECILNDPEFKCLEVLVNHIVNNWGNL